MKGDWISVKDNLPAPGEEVLFYDRTHENVEIGSLVTRRDAWHPRQTPLLIQSMSLTGCLCPMHRREDEV